MQAGDRRDHSLIETAAVLLDGRWRQSAGMETFLTTNPQTGESLGSYPISPWTEVEDALAAGARAYDGMHDVGAEAVPHFLERFADRIEKRADGLVEVASAETALPENPRLADVELPRTMDQLRQAAAAARSRSWKRPVISSRARIASFHESIAGVVCVFGPNNFPLAFNGASGGDFAAAVATGHPIIAKANPGHPATTRMLAEEGSAAATEVGLPSGFIQLIYRTSHADGARLVADGRVAATAYTGSRQGGLALKRAAEASGNLIYLEMSSVNPVVVLPGAWRERGLPLAEELASSLLTGAGQFCTSPGLLFVLAGPEADEIRASLKRELEKAPVGTLLGGRVVDALGETAAIWEESGARLVASASSPEAVACSYPNSMMEIDGAGFLNASEQLQKEAFGNLSLLIVCENVDELRGCLDLLEGNLTGSIYSATTGEDDVAYATVVRALRPRVGRLLNDKAPTGVAVVPAMNHGGPFPSTGHAGFTAVGIPASLERFSMLQCFDNVRDDRLPPDLQADNPLGLVRHVNGEWTSSRFVWG